MRPSKEEEQELIRYYEDRRGQTGHWGKPVPIRVRRGGPSAVFSLRLTAEELTLFQKEAERRGVTVSQLIREATLREIKGPAGEADLTQAADSLRHIATLIERRERAAGAGPAAPRPALRASEERAEYRAEDPASPPRKRTPRRKA